MLQRITNTLEGKVENMDERIRNIDEEISRLEEKLEKRDQVDEYFSEVFVKVQIYTSLGRSLCNFWFRRLPWHVQEGLFNAQLFNLPRCFMIWWFVWNTIDPVQFPIPAIVSTLFPCYSPDDDDDRIHFLLIDVASDNLNKQTELGNLLEEAWNRIDETDRLLMIVCWAAQQDRNIWNKFAHPTISRAKVASILLGDLQADGGDSDPTRNNLLARASGLIPQTFKDD